jgi:hypothetical protein
MKRILGTILFALTLSSLSSVAAFAQANNGAGEGKPVIHVDFYRLPPGRQDEWLALYKKVHFQIMQWEKAQGQIISETVYKRGGHHLSPAWDIAIYTVSPPAGQKRKPDLTRTQLIHKLFDSDLDGYVKAERERWALTLEHWDETWVAIDLEKNPSFYYPDPLN